MPYQDITHLYTKDESVNIGKMREIKEWLETNVGEEGNARSDVMNYDWAWSLTAYLVSIHTSPTVRDWRGIYFRRDYDVVAFRLKFGSRSQ